MAEEWLIDGYNLLHAVSPGAKGPKAVPRETLFGLVAGHAAYERQKTLMVLDGKGREEELSAYRTGYFGVVFSGDVSADSYIERYAFAHRQTKGLVVVTNDRAISNLIRGYGLRVLSCADYLGSIGDSSKEAGETLFKERSKGYAFSRPFEKALKKKGLI